MLRERHLSQPQTRGPTAGLLPTGRAPSLGAGAVALCQRLEVHGKGLLLRLCGALPVGARQDVEHDSAEGSQQQAQHVGQDALRLKQAVLGPAGSGCKGGATQGVTIRTNAICTWAGKMPGPNPAPPSPTQRKPLGGANPTERGLRGGGPGEQDRALPLWRSKHRTHTHPSLNSSASFRPSRAVPTERRKMAAPKKVCCGRYWLRRENEAPGNRKKLKPTSH